MMSKKPFEDKFWLVYMFLGALLMGSGILGGHLIGQPIREIKVSGPPVEILSLPSDEAIAALGQPKGTAPCAEILNGAEGGDCYFYQSLDGKWFNIVAVFSK